MGATPKTQFFTSLTDPGQVTAYRSYGSRTAKSNTPLVLIQGMSAVGTIDWHDLAQELAKSRLVVTFDNRDIGQSTWKNPKPFTLGDLANDVAALIEHLGYREVDICGHSMGGMIAQTLLVTQGLPFTIKHAILGATAAKNPQSDLGSAMASYLGQCKKEGKKPDPKKMSEVMMRNCYDEQWIRKNPQLFEQRLEEAVSSRRPAQTIAAQQRAIGRYDVSEGLKALPSSIRVLVIHGDLDVAVYPQAKDTILASIKHAQLQGATPHEFAHNWYDYFNTDFWVQQLSSFLNDEPKSKL